MSGMGWGFTGLMSRVREAGKGNRTAGPRKGRALVEGPVWEVS